MNTEVFIRKHLDDIGVEIELDENRHCCLRYKSTCLDINSMAGKEVCSRIKQGFNRRSGMNISIKEFREHLKVICGIQRNVSRIRFLSKEY